MALSNSTMITGFSRTALRLLKVGGIWVLTGLMRAIVENVIDDERPGREGLPCF